MHSSIYAEGRERGQEEGREEGSLAVLYHLFERRLGRTLSTAEQQIVCQHVRARGPNALADLVLDASPVELTALLMEART